MKPCVHYDLLVRCEAGQRALVRPLNHPQEASVSNRSVALTSIVLAYDPDTGEFETENTRYRPAPTEHARRLRALRERVARAPAL
jgi:hypothetical protein